MISFFPVLLALICAENFQPSADFKSCVCLDLLSANKSKCVKSCEEIGETSFAGRCVNAIGLKSAASNDDCVALYNQGSIWDGASGCKCDNANGYAGDSNSFCTDCKRLSQYAAGSSCVVPCTGYQVLQNNICQNCPTNTVPSFDHMSCVTCILKYGTGSISLNLQDCVCDKSKGFVGKGIGAYVNSVCVDCWRQGKIINDDFHLCQPCGGVGVVLQNGICQNCPNGLVPSEDGLSCITCNQKYGIGSIYVNLYLCVCDKINGFTSLDENSVCTDCLRSDAQDKSACSATCSIKETWDSVQKKCVCDVASGYGGVSGACSCDIDKGYAGIDICTKCWDQAKIATISVCQDCPANEVFAPNSLSQCSCDSSKGYSGLPGSCSCSQPGFALTLGVCWNCAQNNQVTSPSGCQACPEFEKINPSTKACVCDSSLGYTGVSGGCYCNFGVGLIQAIDNNGVKSCVCKSSNGHVLDAASPSVSCKCDASTGHAGQPGACFCDSSTGHFGYPGFCMCNFNLQFVGSAGSCKNCAALNAHASQFNGAYFCRCNGDSGYGSPDAGGTCRLCASGNSVVQVDGQGQFQCVACAATEKVVKNMCVCATARSLRYTMDL
ncbi:Conserved_hypothetical protein [Hexamita inflata]|uniref:Uncharacterized protein n=1 Tax=Hexamita inflata TaxID=28002 RepID=A0AA86QGH5_9EUKA|nr:Conserved hypothetical protein [Hexamita inflata]